MPPFGFVVDALARNYRRPNVAETLAAFGEKDVLAGRAADLPRGTVFVWGAEDPICPVAGARESAVRVPASRVFVFPGVGHDTPLEAPRAFQRLLVEVLGP